MDLHRRTGRDLSRRHGVYLFDKWFADHRLVEKLRSKPGFKHAMALAQTRPRTFVFFNRYAYGVRLLGGLTCGIAEIDWLTFLLYNALSSLVWASLFTGIGYFFGLGLEAFIGGALRAHQRLVITIFLIVAFALGAIVIRGWIRAREKRLEK